MRDFVSSAMLRLADLTEMTLKINNMNVVEGFKDIKFAVGGHVFGLRLNVIGSAACTGPGLTVLLLEASRGSLGLAVGTTNEKPQQSFVLIVDMTKVQDKHRFDSWTSLTQVMASVGQAIVKGYLQDDKEQPWHERDMSEFAVA